MLELRDDHERMKVEVAHGVNATCNSVLDKSKNKTPFDGSAPKSAYFKPKEKTSLSQKYKHITSRV